jgi:molybdate transport system substrate-binding protein
MGRHRLLFLNLCLMIFLVLTGGVHATETVTVYAAASLKNVVDEIAQVYERNQGVTVIAVYAASSVLARQIENGAPADLFISADQDWMDYLATRQLVKRESAKILVHNRLVLIAPSASRVQLDISPHFPLAAKLGNERLAMAEPRSVPAGKYGKAALQALGVWSDVQAKVAPMENVRAVLMMVARNEAPFGIVYRTDALVENHVRIVGEFPANTYPPINYPMALTAGTKSPAAAAFLNYLVSPAAHTVFEKYGF